jgi:uncharacterized protein with FMN-binding domain
LSTKGPSPSVTAAIVLLAAAVALSGCSTIGRGALRKGDLVDGVYRASYIQFPNRAVVEVTVKGQRMTEIRIISHITGMGRKAEVPIVERMLAAQSTQVDAVTGATNSSKCITKAVQRAIDKACRK